MERGKSYRKKDSFQENTLFYPLPKEILLYLKQRTAVNSTDLQDYKLENCPADLEETDRETYSSPTIQVFEVRNI